ncbi:ATP-dependent DNA helicase [Natronoflexus pectinivorans]|uniref:Exodeoxyribonuclease-5 n=1 Tax=Natronoflexus pectinivorans TaxID=682526 RepID=A0A4R2GF96_9BACT|nr:AAA family ATPase [Natronoflexus pectinivorans]TCO05969.1 exodeoxyribonuclease-5 [Natronoflexus pectinivorans]
MVKEHILNRISATFKHNPTPSQHNAIDALASFMVSAKSMPLQLIKGYAGTGKTSLISAFVNVLGEMGIKCVLLAPTGRAAKVLSNSAGQPAFTIHKQIYRQKSSKDGFGGFLLGKNLHKDTVFIVDEASMIANNSSSGAVFGSGRLLDDLIQYVYEAEKCRMVLIGDSAQLPPVGLDVSPALDTGELETYGLDLNEVELTDVVRQTELSSILQNATYLRELLMNNLCDDYPKLEIVNGGDVKNITGAELQGEINHCYEQYGEEETLIVCRTNKRANQYNIGIRNSILFREDELSTGDNILVMKNNYHWVKEDDKAGFIANGDIARVVRIKKHYELYGYRFADVVCELVDYRAVEIDVRVILDSISSDGAGFSYEQQEKFLSTVMEDYADVSTRRKQFELARENDFYNALQIKFAYAMTCHKAQGGQWKAVFIDLGYFTEEYLGRELIRWLYTAVTRATERLYLVNFPKEFLR